MLRKKRFPLILYIYNFFSFSLCFKLLYTICVCVDKFVVKWRIFFIINYCFAILDLFFLGMTTITPPPPHIHILTVYMYKFDDNKSHTNFIN